MPALALKKFLDDQNIKYETVKHLPAYTSQEIAAITHIPGSDLLKPVMLKIDGKLAMMVEPANQRVSLSAVKKQLKAKEVELASELEFEEQFKGCEVGAMPPLGELFDVDVYLSKRLKEDEWVAFNAGNHEELIKMSAKTYFKLAKPKKWIDA